ncbi:MAG: tetratricopeptide repeat protein [Hellea sp.]
MLGKILVFALVLQFSIGSSAAFAQISGQIETSRPDPRARLAHEYFEAGKAAHDGVNAAQDFEKARKLYLEAADFGSNEALINLGYLYFTGQGVKVDFLKARKFYEAASKRGSVDAKQNLKMMDARGLGILPAVKPDAPAKEGSRPKPIIAAERSVPITKDTAFGRSVMIVPAMSPHDVNAAVNEPKEEGSSDGKNSIITAPSTPVLNTTERAQIVQSSVFPAILRPAEKNLKAIGQRLFLMIDNTEKIAAWLLGLVSLALFIHLFAVQKHNREREIRRQFVRFFYEAKRNDLRLTYLRRRNNGFVEATFYKEWHATLTVLMARYALNFDEPNETLKVFCKNLNHGLCLRLRPTQHIASEYSDKMIQAALSEIKAVDAYHSANINEEIAPFSSKQEQAQAIPILQGNVINLFQNTLHKAELPS